MISIDDLEGVLDVTVKRGPARLEGESDEEYLARVEREEQPEDTDK